MKLVGTWPQVDGTDRYVWETRDGARIAVHVGREVGEVHYDPYIIAGDPARRVVAQAVDETMELVEDELDRHLQWIARD